MAKELKHKISGKTIKVSEKQYEDFKKTGIAQSYSVIKNIKPDETLEEDNKVSKDVSKDENSAEKPTRRTRKK